MRKIFLIVAILFTTMLFAQDIKFLSMNSHSTVLGSNATYTGLSTNIEGLGGYSSVAVTIFANHAVGVNGTLRIQQSPDGSNWDGGASYTIATNTTYTKLMQINYRFIRIVFENGAEIQTAFRLSTVLFKADISGASGSTMDDILVSSDSLLAIAVNENNDALGAKKVAVINGVQFHYTAGNGITATNTAVADSISIVYPMASYHFLSIDSFIGATTQNIIIKMFRTNDATASLTDPYDGKWIPQSVAFLGASDETGVTAANTTVNANYENTTPITAEFYMLRVSFTGATNTYNFVDKRSH